MRASSSPATLLAMWKRRQGGGSGSGTNNGRPGLLAGYPLEHAEQAAVVKWCLDICPDRDAMLIYAIANGGWRTKATAGKLKAEGVRPGVPDLCLPVPRGGYHSLYLEMKRQQGSNTSRVQKVWIEALQQQGHQVVVAHGAAQAIEAVQAYLRLGRAGNSRQSENRP